MVMGYLIYSFVVLVIGILISVWVYYFLRNIIVGIIADGVAKGIKEAREATKHPERMENSTDRPQNIF